MKFSDDRVDAAIKAAAVRRRRAREHRAELDKARTHGLTARHATKLAQLDRRDTPRTSGAVEHCAAPSPRSDVVRTPKEPRMPNELDDGYYAIPDPREPAAMTYWRARRGSTTAWPPRTLYGPWPRRSDAPDDPDERKAFARRVADTYAAWLRQVRAELLADPDSARARFAALAVRCCVCCRTLTDPESKTSGVGPECRTRLTDGQRQAIREALRRAHATHART